SILSEDADLIVICRNQDNPEQSYPENVKLLRLGKLKTAREKEAQNVMIKVCEYANFILSTVFFVRFHSCRTIYAFDMHGFASGMIASRCGRKRAVIYHNLDLGDRYLLKGMSYLVKRLELFWARFADKIIFPDRHRAEIFKDSARLKNMPDIVMNAPLTVTCLPRENNLLPLLDASGISRNARVLLIQGCISDLYYVSQVVRALVFLPQDAILVLLGWSNSDFISDLYRLAASLYARERVVYIPPVPYSRLFSYTIGSYLGIAFYRAIDSNRRYNAGASNKLFEYLSLGIPVLTNDALAFREVVGEDSAYFANPDSVEAIAGAINSAFLDSEGYSRRKEKARQMHLNKLNFERQFAAIREYIIGNYSK
ncbi:MAG TPA: glycosyltransferase, partial [Candidatus Margulisiibacteriota bacterium]|nr:glycosyltransferase [Candidatus Margulisiibacteriota bacterium]